MSAEKVAQVPYKMWRAKPPGEEQIELDRMFKSREIDNTDSADSVRKTVVMFKQFSPKVFASHFRTTKSRYGFCATALGNAENDQHPIPELGPVNDSSIPTQNAPVPVIHDILSVIDFQSAPFCIWMYTDHTKKNDYVCVAMPMFSGCRNVIPKLSEDGTKVTITYAWPNAIFQAKTLFEADIEDETLTLEHPKIHSFVSNWMECGITENSSPKGQITIALPCKVKRELGSYERKAIKVGNTNVLMMQFTAYQKSLLVDEADDTLNFD